MGGFCLQYRDMRYVRVAVHDLDRAIDFASTTFGLQLDTRAEGRAYLRSDARNYALCYTTGSEPAAVALTVGSETDLLERAETLRLHGFNVQWLEDDACLVRQVKKAVSVTAPNGVMVEVVWRPLTSGWRYHGPRDAGIIGLQAVALASGDVTADEVFWTKGMGLTVTDWAGDATFLALDDAHHRIAIYPSDNNGILGVTWAVESKNNVMTNWYHLQNSQAPIVAGPGRQPTSNAIFVTTRTPDGLLMSYAAETDEGPHIQQRGPRQFADDADSHCAWGSPTKQSEFLGGPKS